MVRVLLALRLCNERVVLWCILALGICTRLAVISKFPTIPHSDFNALVAFGSYLNIEGISQHGNSWFWEYLNPGLPLVLCGLFKLFPGVDPGSVARVATVLVCGVMPVLPFLLWRGVFGFGVRAFAAVLLALWPGQVFFSGVVAQDNWVLVPTVALAALAARVLQPGERGHPLAAGLLYAASIVIRQEMLVVLFPLFLAAAGMRLPVPRKQAVVACLAAGIPLLGISAYRYACTGRFALSTEHTGSSVLGSYIPGATVNGWADVLPFVASVKPELLRDRKALFAGSGRLAVQEALRRPVFHAARIVASTATLAIAGEGGNLYWSLQAPEVLPEAARVAGSAMASRLMRPLHIEMALIHALFFAALIVGIRRRDPAILLVSIAVLLKYALHAVTVPQGRYLLAATALQFLCIALGVHAVLAEGFAVRGWWALRLVAIGVVLAVIMGLGGPRLLAYVQNRDTDGQRTYRFWLAAAQGAGELSCRIDRGLLTALDSHSFSMRTMETNPAPGEAAVARCEWSGGANPHPVNLEVLDSYAPGGLPDRFVQRVEVEGREVYSHDIAREAGTGWANVPLGTVPAGKKESVVVEVRAIRPDPGAVWGAAAVTGVRLAIN